MANFELLGQTSWKIIDEVMAAAVNIALRKAGKESLERSSRTRWHRPFEIRNFTTDDILAMDRSHDG